MSESDPDKKHPEAATADPQTNLVVANAIPQSSIVVANATPQALYAPQFQDSRNRAIQCFTLGKVFQRRANKYAKLTEWLSFWGIIVPSMIGITVLSFGLSMAFLPTLLVIAGIIIVIQFFFSVLSLTQKWTDSLQYSLESAAMNFDLSNSFHAISLRSQNPPSDFAVIYAELCTKDQIQEASDEKKAVKDKERHRGYREALLKFQQACPVCKKVPTSIKKTSCEPCGDI